MKFRLIPFSAVFFVLSLYAAAQTPAPQLRAVQVDPVALGVGQCVTGTGFGNGVGTLTITLNGAAIPPYYWEDAQACFPIPEGTPLGTATVQLANAAGASNVLSFVVAGAVTLNNVSPASGAVGAQITLTGSGFGDTQGNGFVQLFASKLNIVSWSDTQIVATIPTGMPSGSLSLGVHVHGALIGATFTVPMPPQLMRMQFDQAVPGTIDCVNGKGIGDTQGTVTVNGLAAIPTFWSDGQVCVTIPPATSVGPASIQLTSAMGQSNVLPFTVVAAPAISAVTPASGAAGTPVTITGSDFGSVQFFGSVALNGVNLEIVSWSDRQIVVIIPGGFVAGSFTLAVTAHNVEADTPFLLLVPPAHLASMTIDPVVPGIGDCVNGTGFTSIQGQATLNGAAVSIFYWVDTRVCFMVPEGTPLGTANVQVTNAGGASNVLPFELVAAPTLSSVSPPSAAAGTRITIAGTGFGAVQGSGWVFVSYAQIDIVSWSDTQIVGTIPAQLSPGTVGIGVVVHGSEAGSTYTIPPLPRLTSLWPNTVALGAALCVNGTGFSTEGTVTVNGVAAAPTYWSENQLCATIPQTTSPGPASVQVTSVAGKSNVLTFTVIAVPAITDVSPVSGPPGTQITISGSNFGVTQGNSTVLIGSTVASVSSWSDTQIVATVAVGSATGAVSVNISGVATLGPAFTVPVPTLGRISPASGGYGTPVRIIGTNFGSAQNGGTVTFSGVSAAPLSWTDTAILVFVPSGLTLGDNAVIVTVAGSVAVGPGIFTLNPSPVITGISPTFGPVGTEVVVSGTDFGLNPNQGLGGSITFGSKSATPTSWTATSITVTVPNGVMSGPNPVIVSGPKGDSPAGTYFNAIVQPEVDSLSPPAGPDGTFVTVRGSGFGAVQGSSTVRIGGAVASPTSWSATNVVVVLPANLPPGVNPVVLSIPGYGDIGSATGFIVQQNPAISSLSSPSGPEGATVTINGANFGAAQGTGTVTFNHTPATVASWNDGAIVANVPAGANTGPVLVNVNGVDSNGRRFVVGDVTPSISITPNTMAMLVGESKPLTVVDATGSPVSGVSWQISDATIGSISTDDPATLTASASGQATLTASYNGLSAQAILNSYAGSTLPLGTEIWSIAPDPGPDSSFWHILQTVRTSDGTVDLIGIQNGNTAVGLSANGSVVWTATIPPGAAVPDSSGGLLVGGLTKIDGKTGQQLWSNPYHDSYGYGPQLAIHPDGTIFTALTTQIAPRSLTAEVIGIDPLHGNAKFRIPLEQSSYTSRNYCIEEVYSGTSISPALTGPVIVASDGNAYLTYSYDIETGGTYENCNDGGWGAGSSFLILMKVDSSGSATSTLLKVDSGRSLKPGTIIPDGQDGFLVTQDGVGYYDQAVHILRVSSTGGVTDFTMASLRYAVGQLILGENGTAFATDSFETVAFDINTGQEKWTWPASLTFIAASAGGGLVAKDGEQVVRFDASGTPTYDEGSVSGSILDYWTLGRFFGLTDTGALNFLQKVPVASALSVWPFPEGNRQHNQSPHLPRFLHYLPSHLECPPNNSNPHCPSVAVPYTIAYFQATVQQNLYPILAKTTFKLRQNATWANFQEDLKTPVEVLAFIGHAPYIPVITEAGEQDYATGLDFFLPFSQLRLHPDLSTDPWGEPLQPVSKRADTLVGLEFPWNSYDLTPETIVVDKLETSATILFFSACNLKPSFWKPGQLAPFLQLWDLSPTSPTKALVVSNTSNPAGTIDLVVSAFVWTRLSVRLAKGEPVGIAVDEVNKEAASMGFKESWEVIGDRCTAVTQATDRSLIPVECRK